MSRRQVTRADDEMGRVRFCRRCAEWWPDDEEFWQTIPAGGVRQIRGRFYVRKTATKVCRACHRTNASALERERAFRERARTKSVGCATPGCVVLVPLGRSHCYGCRGETIGPLTIERMTEYGLSITAL